MTISKILVANRGEIARRVFRTCREMGISTVAVYSEPDATEPHVIEADEAVLLSGAVPAYTYLNIDAVLAAAKETGADAIHPGYGFLAENSTFARAVTDSSITWIGPSPESIEIMGSKIESKRLMEEIGVPTLRSVDIDSVEEIGFPVLVKASAGGGGKGMRIVSRPNDLTEAIESARREAASAFGDNTVFLEKYLEAPRHIEIQVFGDTHGKVISLFERECSIQRRHQKIIEESPSPGIDDAVREALGEAAVEAARAVDYVGAGTVEFLYQDDQFFFLEMNTRLQVEHPVTEMVTGVDLVRMQIEIADDGAVGEEPTKVSGHAIEARLYAEDPLNDFLPVTGRFHRFWFDETEGLRVDSGIADGSEVSVHYDPMIAKVIAHGATRADAADRLASALRRAHIHGSITNRALLVRVLESDEFLLGQTDTHFLERHNLESLASPLASERDEGLAAIAAALTDQAHERADAGVLPTIPAGWRNSLSQLQRRSYLGTHGEYEVAYSLGPSGFDVVGIGSIRVIEAHAEKASFTVDRDEHHYQIARYGDERFIDSASGPARLVAIPRFPSIGPEEDVGSLHSPMPGQLIRVEVTVGDDVVEGQVLVVLEAMKMEHTLRSPHDGTVTEVRHEAGDQIEADAILVVVDRTTRSHSISTRSALHSGGSKGSQK